MDRAILEEEFERRWILEQQAILDRHRRLMRQARAAEQWRNWQQARASLLFAVACSLGACLVILVLWKAI